MSIKSYDYLSRLREIESDLFSAIAELEQLEYYAAMFRAHMPSNLVEALAGVRDTHDQLHSIVAELDKASKSTVTKPKESSNA